MKILISKNEILNNYDWENFCDLLKNEIDINIVKLIISFFMIHLSYCQYKCYLSRSKYYMGGDKVFCVRV